MTQELRFAVAGSTGAVYEIVAVRDGGTIRLGCTCDAGANGQACKHRLALIEGDTSAIISANAHEAALLPSWLAGTPLDAAFRRLAEAEAALAAAKRTVTSAKKALGRTMLSGAG